PARPRVGPPSFADSDPRYAAGRDRPRRGPSKVRGAHATPSNPATRRGFWVQLRRGTRGGLPDRLPRSSSAVVRPRWPRDGDRPRRRGSRPVHGKGGTRLEVAPGPRGPVSVPRDRDRRGRRRGWQGHLHRRDPGAHRGSGHSLRRRRVCIAGPDPLRSRPRGDPPNHAEALPRAGDRRPDEPSARGEGRCRVRPRGESARESNDSLRLEGHRRVPRESRDEGDARSIPAQHGPRGRGEHRPRRREGPRVPVPEAPRRRHDPRPRDEEHGRGDGDRSVPRPRVLQGNGRGGERPADGGGGGPEYPVHRDDPGRGGGGPGDRRGPRGRPPSRPSPGVRPGGEGKEVKALEDSENWAWRAPDSIRGPGILLTGLVALAVAVARG